MHSVYANLKVYASGHASTCQSTCLAPVGLSSYPMLNGLDYVHALHDMHVVGSLTCDQQHYSP